ncbi:MAG TPA: polyribonucleotide nucleotidyltransferase [Candidatus Hydrogenedens sp.]|nr:polyribonucleotide nucleotidyltransferase [Candidatus Hydrogenedens sp.]HOK10436.1 polyribonucleotide nucleotidyltransferase [Candidatus Hydrogenedens sp.]HOL20629.1 polyribonucleotide nucleotidyltransferase [Candidatus Hydrogenedens sp.]HPP59917.1 polyribonucleotide nucleotidyltransferase [Candidatus Hydrogenedens sp.]
MVEKVSVTVGSKEILFETGKIAKQADGSVICQCGDTIVLSTACVDMNVKPDVDFFPLTVDYREKFYSVGQIPGNFFRRESKPSEREILVSRLTDRPLRPLFPKAFKNEVQVCQTVLSADNIHDPDVLSINAASASLHISPIPLLEPIGAVRVGYIDGNFIVNPAISEMKDSLIDLVVAGTADAICMVEGMAKEVSEQIMLEALEFGHEWIKKIVSAIEELRSKCGKEKIKVEEPIRNAELEQDVKQWLSSRIETALFQPVKHERRDAIKNLEEEVLTYVKEKYTEEQHAEFLPQVKDIFEEVVRTTLREQVIKDNRRVDGRALNEIRPITIEIGILPRAHGSALFTRGETQALVTTTLGTSQDEQRLDELTGDAFSRFFLHYNFPPWSVGEVGKIGAPGRREVGHGKLAERALTGVLPFDPNDSTLVEDPTNAFPYVVRVVSDITESNGSSSMATVCGGSLSLMDAGVPIKAHVAGIAMGLIKEGDEFRILTDILGDEDHLGDMDFKVCGTREGITAFQMDTKIKGVPRSVMEQALEQAKQGRLHILEKMEAVIPQPRPEISPYAPRIYTIKIDPDKIREVIGPGGKIIRDIQLKTGTEITIQNDGTVLIAAVDKESADKTIDMIQAITAEVEVGKIYHGKVTRIMNFGAFVSLLGNREGLIHISELAPHRVREVTDEVNIGDEVDVKVIEVDKFGRINLSKVQADIELGKIPNQQKSKPTHSEPPYDRFDRKDRGGRNQGRNNFNKHHR